MTQMKETIWNIDGQILEIEWYCEACGDYSYSAQQLSKDEAAHPHFDAHVYCNTCEHEHKIHIYQFPKG